ncbi:MAG: hypothetical protein WCB05_22055, partial [Candidatus Sulfotelmatobacter sp.]
MPAGVWAIPFAVGGRAHSREGEVTEGISSSGVRDDGTRDDQIRENQDPARGRMAGQARRIDDTMLIREAQRGNRAAFEELVR